MPPGKSQRVLRTNIKFYDENDDVDDGEDDDEDDDGDDDEDDDCDYDDDYDDDDKDDDDECYRYRCCCNYCYGCCHYHYWLALGLGHEVSKAWGFRLSELSLHRLNDSWNSCSSRSSQYPSVPLIETSA